ncbi:MAG: archaetidylserine decarboxylase, partial [Granulosicoccaceae bacterium]
MAKLFAQLQLVLPHHAISRVVFFFTRLNTPLARPVMAWFARVYGIDMQEAAEPHFDSYASFNAFFTRALRADARPLASGEGVVISPSDGHVSQLGPIENGAIFQAKGHSYTAAELLGSEQAATTFDGGQFITIYLSPRDYHRVHMPLTGALQSTLHVPGRLFSVAQHTVAHVPRLFARNERVVCHFAGDNGPFAQVLVGAINVAAIETVWAGLITPPAAWGARQVPHQGEVNLEQGAE